MIIVGNVYNKEEAKEIEFIAKLFIVGKRARFLALTGFQRTKYPEKV